MKSSTGILPASAAKKSIVVIITINSRATRKSSGDIAENKSIQARKAKCLRHENLLSLVSQFYANE